MSTLVQKVFTTVVPLKYTFETKSSNLRRIKSKSSFVVPAQPSSRARIISVSHDCGFNYVPVRVKNRKINHARILLAFEYIYCIVKNKKNKIMKNNTTNDNIFAIPADRHRSLPVGIVMEILLFLLLTSVIDATRTFYEQRIVFPMKTFVKRHRKRRESRLSIELYCFFICFGSILFTGTNFFTGKFFAPRGNHAFGMCTWT